MATHKRKRQDIEDSDEEDPSFGRQILPVANLPEDFSSEPMDGMQYLFTVRRDSRRLPNFTRVVNPYDVAETAPVKQEPTETPVNLTLPSEEWRSKFLKHFQYFRKNIVQSTAHVGPGTASSEKMMPDKKERDLWWKFLAGHPRDVWNPPKKTKKQSAVQKKISAVRQSLEEPALRQDVARTAPASEVWQINEEGEAGLAVTNDLIDSLPTPNGTPPPAFASTVKDTSLVTPHQSQPSQPSSLTTDTHASRLSPLEPTPALLRHIDHRVAVHLLMYFAHWINLHLEQPNNASTAITSTHGRWMFALLSKVDDYVQADDMSHLRSLARGCISLLKEMPLKVQTSLEDPKFQTENPVHAPHREEGAMIDEGSCWMVFTAVAGVWAQRDLWMDIEGLVRVVP